MSLLKWLPFRELKEVLNSLKRIFWQHPTEVCHETLAAGDWTPPVKISQTDTAYLIKAEIPDVKKEDVQVTIQNGMLTIEGERKLESKGEKRRLDRSCNSFVQRFQMPADTDEATVETEFRDGFMNVMLPKTQKANAPKAKIMAANIAVS